MLLGGLSGRTVLVVGLIAVAAASYAVIAMPMSASLAAEPASPADWVFVSDDDANPKFPGCDAHTVVDARTGTALIHGDYHVSPGRLTTTSDGSHVISLCSNNGQFVYLLRRLDDAWLEADTERIEANVLQGSRSAVTPDDRGLLLSMGLYPGRSDLDRYELAGITKASLGRRSARRRDISAAEIVFGRDLNVAIVLDFAGRVYFLDATTLESTREPIEYQRPSGTARNAFRNTNAAVSPDGRYLVVNSGNRGVVTVIDLDTGASTLVDLPGLHETWDLEFNFANTNHGLLAVHGRNRVAVYRFAGSAPPSLVATTNVRGQVPGDFGQARADYYRGNSIAWTGSGDGVIAAVRHAKEYRLWDFDANAPEPRLRERLNFNGCTGPGQFLQNDVLTLNHRRYPTPTTTPTSCPTPSPTEPATVAPTWTTTPTATVPASATHSPTQTSTIAPTATRMPHPAYLPIALRERCTPDKQRVDAALVIDASSSMLDHTATGRTKLAAAIEAAGTFLHQLQMVAGDQAAIVAFNADAWLLQPLTSDRYALDAALASIEPALQTCLVCGVDVAANELASDRRDPDNTPVMIVLTDGLSNPLPASDAVVRAEDAKRSGVVIYTIGLGDELDFDALEQIASGPESFYRAPDAEQLADIYRQIAVEIPCPAESFWGGR